MYLVARVAGFNFGLPVSLVSKVVEAGDGTNETERAEGIEEADRVDGKDFFRVTKAGKTDRRSAVVLSLPDGSEVVLHVDGLDGFVYGGSCRLYSKPRLLDHYGFDLVDKMAVTERGMLFIAGEAVLEKRLRETAWKR